MDMPNKQNAGNENPRVFLDFVLVLRSLPLSVWLPASGQVLASDFGSLGQQEYIDGVLHGKDRRT